MHELDLSEKSWHYTAMNAKQPLRLSIALAIMLVFAGVLELFAQAGKQPNYSAARLAILSTPHNGPDTYLHIASVDRPFPPPVAVLHHLPGAAVKGAVAPDGTVFVVADYTPGNDRSFGSALFRLEPGASSTLLTDAVVFASRPVIASDGRLFVSQGRVGHGSGDRMRVDTLTLGEVNLHTGAVRTLWTNDGYYAYIAGTFGNDLVVYYVNDSGARLLLVDRDTGREKILLPSMAPFASDFSLSADGDLVFLNRDESRAGLWLVERLSLSSGKLEHVLESTTSRQSPYIWPRGELTWNNGGELRATATSSSSKPPDGYIDIRAVGTDGALAAAYLFSPGSSAPGVILINPHGALVASFSIPTQTPISVAGFLP
jgi:hypothetical protein